jgi:phosphohistidine swiveling domain-containing protein
MTTSPAIPPNHSERAILGFADSLAVAPELLGDKAYMIAWLAGGGFPVSDGFLVPPSVVSILATEPARFLKELADAMEGLVSRAGAQFGDDGGLCVSVRPSFLADGAGRGHRFLDIGSSSGARGGGEPVAAQRADARHLETRTAFASQLPAPWNSGPRLELISAIAATDDCEPGQPRSVVVQVMTPFRGLRHSGQGCALTVDPSTGAHEMVGEFIPGVLNDMGPVPPDLGRLRDVLPECYTELTTILLELRDRLDTEVEVEFVVSNKSLYLFQVRASYVSPRALGPMHIELEQPPSPAEISGRGVTISPGFCRAPLHRPQNPEDIGAGQILLVDDLSFLQHTDLRLVAGVIAFRGSRYGHAAARLRRLGIPALVTVEPPQLLSLASTVTIDAYGGLITVDQKTDR